MKEGKQTPDVTATGLNCIFLIMETKKYKKNLFKSTQMPLESNFCLQLRKVKGESLETSLFLSPSCVQSNSWVFCCFVLQPSLAVHCTWECGKGKRKKQERKEKVRWERQDRHETSSSVTNVVATGNASFEREGSWAREEGIWGELCRINYQGDKQAASSYFGHIWTVSTLAR